jgi:1-phosphatidylinositol-4-phosphate 5-kinase
MPEHGQSDEPIHSVRTATITAIQEVHIIQITSESVQLESGPNSDSFLHKVSIETLRESPAGPPPPSPPASIDRIEEDSSTAPVPSHVLVSNSEQVIVSYSETSEQQSSPSRRHTFTNTGPGSSVDRCLSDSRLSARTPLSRTPRDESSLPGSPSGSTLPKDRFLQPPPFSSHRERPVRWNTIGSSPRILQYGSPPVPCEDVNADTELDSDIQKHANHIRRKRQERHSKRIRAQEVAAAFAGGLKGRPQAACWKFDWGGPCELRADVQYVDWDTDRRESPNNVFRCHQS